MSADNRQVVWHPHRVTGAERAAALGQKPAVLWFTGLSGSGKSTLAGALDERLLAMGQHAYLLDGDNVRHGLNADLGFGDADRVENIRRIGEVCRLMVDAGLIVLTAFISPFRADRARVRDLLEPGQFIEVHVDAPLDVCESRDPKGLYRRARAGEIAHFTGIDSAYESPSAPELRLNTAEESLEHCLDRLLDYLERQGHLGTAEGHS
ncbi:MAG: adenylyl-sulfate kinase [Halothiobacillaceae bacterium]